MSDKAAPSLADIEARVGAATAGPWFAIDRSDESSEWYDDFTDECMVVTGDSEPGNYAAVAGRVAQGHDGGASDATLIANAPTDLAALTAAVRAVLALAAESEARGGPYRELLHTSQVRAALSAHIDIEGGK